MENKYFKPAGDLDDTPISMGVEVEDEYFRKTGDLGKDTVDFKVPDGVPHKNGADRYFRPAGDIVDDSIRPIFLNEDKYDLKLFKNPEKINVIPPKIYDKNIYSIDKSGLSSREMENYLLTVVSGKRYDGVCEFGVLMGSGRMIVSFEELKRMVDKGYNIVSAQCLNADLGLIEVEFQKYVYDEELMEKRRRF